MTGLLIIEGNTPGRVARGQSASESFLRTFAVLKPGLEPRVVNPYDRSLCDEDFDCIDGAVFTGSGEDWAVDAPEAAPQRAAMEAACRVGVPVWGSCNGMNLAALIMGGTIGTNPKGIEVGFAADLQLTQAGEAHPMMEGRSSGFSVPCIHRDHVSYLPSCAELMAWNAHTDVQAFVIETGGVDVWATQYHPEASPSDIAVYLRAQGVFGHLSDVANVLERKETPAFAERSRELANWLLHVEKRREAHRHNSTGQAAALA